MSWQELSISVAPERAEAVEMLMMEAGAQAVTLVPNEQAAPVLEPAPAATPLWETLIARGLFAADLDGALLRLALGPQLQPDEARSMALTALADQPWERVWLDHFEPVHFGAADNLCICPWHYEPTPAGDVLFMDPGLAFGTGSHATTALCLDQLADLKLEDQAVLDLGCGSGILALAAALRGAASVVAVDNDPQALLATGENARRNGLAVTVAPSLEQAAGPFDLIVANILSGTLIDYADILGKLARPGTRLMLSGILEAQAESVTAAYADAFSDFAVQGRDGWVLLLAAARS
ncbi:MAG: 50S ribosomal protein L11 methyltransferase [Pseudomonadota bacterium]